ncbi:MULTISPECIES: PepSY domain-containing protein [Agrococcus]|uniref:PepSY domain-containing protein n=1 Tax=Agrococcus pavilionensis RW1 TaxID=1330458 RepID=U1MTU1_9MICO|nr:MULTISPECIES: PepSY domain-containing protein [Agrococcus]ERG64085.1 hypothetical protein L332_06405 [Agrococcus pavilionensis RW1]MBO1769599.1 hypothetical protein [Agrococcus sp. TF02-05]
MAIDTKLRAPLLIAVAATGTLALASCSGEAGNQQPQRSPEPVATSAVPDASESGSGSSAEPSESGRGIEGIESAIAAIERAEEETGGVAYEIDNEDQDRAWEIDIADGTRQITVIVSGDGSSIVSTSDDAEEVDADDRAALDAAGITLVEALEAAADEIGEGSAFDDASLEDEGDAQAWQVSFEDGGEVFVSIADGSILRVDGI